MAVQRIHDEGQTLQTPSGKILGIVDSRAQFDDLATALSSAGFTAEALCGEDGVQLLERIDQFFFSDLEDRVLRRHLEELKAGHIIIAIKAASERRDEAVRVATENGARGLVHFGHFVVTWISK
jgi:hypothetical protein